MSDTKEMRCQPSKKTWLYCTIWCKSKEPGTRIWEVTSLDASGLIVKSITVRLGADNAEAKVIVPVVRIVVVPLRGSNIRS